MKMLGTIIVAAVSMAGCDGDDGKRGGRGKGQSTTCTADETGYWRCKENSQILQQCNGSTWTDIQDCAATSLTCQVIGENVADCRTDSAVTVVEYGGCDSTSLVCDEGLDCTDSILGKICLTDCSSDAGVCDSGEYCVNDLPAGVIIEAPRCFGTSDEDAFCISDGGCPGSEDECGPMPSRWGRYGLQCLDRCAPNDLGTSTGCSGSDVCVEGTSIEVEFDTNGVISCPGEGDDGNCDTDKFYKCTYFSGDEDWACARIPTVCGTALPSETSLSSVTVPDAKLCGVPQEAKFCARPADGTGTAECTIVSEDGGVIVGYWDIECTTNDECVLGGICVSLTPGNRCGFYHSACFTFCDDEDGNALTCPSALPNCTAQDPGGIVYGFADVYEGGESSKVTCSGASDTTSCTSPFTCQQESPSEFYCARYRNICTD